MKNSGPSRNLSFHQELGVNQFAQFTSVSAISHEVGYGIQELEGMSYITGTLRISNLENAVNAGEAKLDRKEMLNKLGLELRNKDDALQDEAAEVRVLEDLLPHSDLKELQILHFMGTIIPLWMIDGQLQNLSKLPSRFPNVGDLKIKGCHSLKTLAVTPVPRLLVLDDNLVLEDLNEVDGSSLVSWN